MTDEQPGATVPRPTRHPSDSETHIERLNGADGSVAGPPVVPLPPPAERRQD